MEEKLFANTLNVYFGFLTDSEYLTEPLKPLKRTRTIIVVKTQDTLRTNTRTSHTSNTEPIINHLRVDTQSASRTTRNTAHTLSALRCF